MYRSDHLINLSDLASNLSEDIDLYSIELDEEIFKDTPLEDRVITLSKYANKELSGFMNSTSSHEKTLRIKQQSLFFSLF